MFVIINAIKTLQEKIIIMLWNVYIVEHEAYILENHGGCVIIFNFMFFYFNQKNIK